MANGAEYSGDMDRESSPGLPPMSKTVEKFPRPVTLSRDQLRLLSLTGDITGNSPVDGMDSWTGIDSAKWDARVEVERAHQQRINENSSRYT